MFDWFVENMYGNPEDLWQEFFKNFFMTFSLNTVDQISDFRDVTKQFQC